MDKKGEKERKREEGKKMGENEQERERERKEKKGGFRLSISSTEVGLSVFVGARGKVDPRNESYAWVPKFGSFVKLQEVENFSTWIIYSLKVI